MRVPAVHAHRGSPDPALDVRENTLEAFARARRLGADGVELDVRRTADGALAVHHDPEIAGAGALGELTSERLPGWVPLLGAALDACRGLQVNIELKNLPGEPGFDPGELMARAVAEVVAGVGQPSAVVISSFWPPSLDAVHEVHPELATGLLVADWFDSAEAVPMALRHGCSALHPHASLVDETLVGQAHETGLSVSAWTVNAPSLLREIAALGVDTVITDDVATATTVFGRGR